MYERIAKLVERLYEKTEAKTLLWEKNAHGNFETSFPNYTVELSYNDGDVILAIYNDEGDIVESILSNTFLQSMDLIDCERKMRELYRMARRTALGSDEAVERLISALEE